jgi:DNA invertase Pin-like site-specific DNA recombinase
MMTASKIQQQHVERPAYIYLRQSTLAQVRFNQESTQRQYALQERAQQLGWPQHAIKILDGDLGISGTQVETRKDFKLLVADVSMGKVGAVFALEASRLSRSCTDWHRLLELCALTQTLIIDEDGCYNPSDFNDQLLLGLKGTMSQAELHFIRARLQGGKLNKAKKGELCSPLPVGFCYDEERHIILDTDEQVRHTIQLLFKVFKEKGSAYGVVHYFGRHNLQFPKRAYGGIWKGKLIWGSLTHTRVLSVLKNPCYAGAYVYGRYRYQKKLSNTGELQIITKRLPMNDWHVMIKEHHQGYITWEDYLMHQDMLSQNQTNAAENMSSSAVREGLALLQGLLVCGICGHRLTVRYKGNGGIHPTYECNWKKRDGVSSHSCLSIQARQLDNVVAQRILTVINSEQIAIAVKAFEELEQRTQAISKQWQMKIDRANYEAQLAQRRYEEVDPSNRLVAGTLEKCWNGALIALEEIRTQYEEYENKNMLVVTQRQKDQLLSLTKNFHRIWDADSTSSKDRKRILRLLINDITVEKVAHSRLSILHMRWQGGATESIEVELPQKSHDKWRHSSETINEVKQFAVTMTDEQIVEKFNQMGLKTNKGNTFTVDSIKWIRYKHKISSPRLQKLGELSINQAAEKFNVSHHVIRYWIERGIINARSIGSKLWVTIEEKQEIELKKRVKHSTKIAVARLKSQTKIAGGAL